MAETNSYPVVQTFEETVFTRAAQLLADPITDSTRKRQSLLLLLSVLSLAVFFGVVVPEKISMPGVDVKVATPLTPTGAPSTTAASVATTALRFNRLLCPVLVYLLLSFWLSLYRDHEAQKYLRKLALLEINEAAARDYAASERRQRRRLAIIERSQSAKDKFNEESAEIQRKIKEIGDEFKKIARPIQEAHAAAFAEFEKRRKEGAPLDSKLEERMWELGAQLEELSEKQDEDTRPLTERFDDLTDDPENRKLNSQMDKILDEVPREYRRHSERIEMLRDLSTHERRWRRYWYLLEVAFPSALGVIAILVPLRSIL